MNKQFSTTARMAFCGLAIAINIVLGIVTAALKFPFYLDVMGTMLIAIFFGPWYGAAVGAATNVLTSIFINTFPDRINMHIHFFRSYTKIHVVL